MQPLITAAPTLLSQRTLTCEHSDREHLALQIKGRKQGWQGLGEGPGAPPPLLWSTVAPARPSCWVGRGACHTGSSERGAGGKGVRKTPLGGLQGVELVP